MGKTLAKASLVQIGLIRAEDVDEIVRTIDSSRTFDSVPIRLRMSDEDVARFAVRRFEFPGLDIKTRQTRWYPERATWRCTRWATVGAISEQDPEHIDRASYAGTSHRRQARAWRAPSSSELHGTNGFREVLVNARWSLGGALQGLSSPDLRVKPPTPGDGPCAVDRPQGPARRGGRARRAPRRGGGARSEHRRRARAREPARLRPDAASAAASPTRRVRGAAGRHRQAAAQPRRAARHLPARLDDQAGHGARRPHLPRGGPGGAQVLCAGAFHLPGSARMFQASSTTRSTATSNLDDAIARSCDIYFYGLADVLGVDRIATFLAPFGFGRTTGIDISGEKGGILPSREWKAKVFTKPADQMWFPGETVNLGVGPGLPQRDAAAAGALRRASSPRAARCGSCGWWPPTATRTGKTASRCRRSRRARLHGVSAEDWQRVVHGMVGVTQHGTAAAVGAQAPARVRGQNRHGAGVHRGPERDATTPRRDRRAPARPLPGSSPSRRRVSRASPRSRCCRRTAAPGAGRRGADCAARCSTPYLLGCGRRGA